MKPKHPPSIFFRLAGAIWYLIVLGVFLLGGAAFGWLGKSKLLRNPLALLNPPKPQEAFHKDVENFLILGCDEDIYYNPGGRLATTPVLKHSARADMLLLARMDFAKGEITGISIPRDTWCRLPDDRERHKINAYYHNAPFGQEAEATKRAVEHLVGVDVDRVIVVNFDSMQQLIDKMGGVPVTVPRQMDYDDKAGNLHIHLKPGRQILDGYAAMGYVRFRHSNDKRFNETDFQRQEREKDLMLGFKRAAITNWANLPVIVDAAKEALGGALTDDQLLSLAGFARGIGQQHIRLGVLPTIEQGNGLRVDNQRLPSVLQQYRLTPSSARLSRRP